MSPLVTALVVALAASVVATGVLARAAARRRADLRRRADHDPLTGLPTRRLLGDRLRSVLAEADRSTRRVAVLAIELRDLAYLNEIYGREVGDAVMAAAADVLRRAVRREESLVRFGGPRFVVVCPDVADRAQTDGRARALLDAVQRPYALDQDRIRLTACAGVAITDPHATPTADDVVLDATIALDQAIHDGRGAIRTYDAVAVSRSLATTEHRLRTALERGELRLLYLPVVALDDRRVVGVEALLRWNDPERGLVEPDRFFHALHETGLIVPVGEWVLHRAARQARAWQDAPGHPPLDVTVNVSARQLLHADFLEQVDRALAESGADPAHLCLEVAEGALVHAAEQLWSILRAAKQRGLKVALDDFGTGHTSLQHLRTFRLDQLKIDRAFVGALPQSRDDRAIVAHVVGLAHDLGVVPVAEGIETAAQLRALRELRCDLGQGFHFSPPQPPEVIDAIRADGLAALDEPPPIVVDVRDPAATELPRRID